MMNLNVRDYRDNAENEDGIQRRKHVRPQDKQVWEVGSRRHEAEEDIKQKCHMI